MKKSQTCLHIHIGDDDVEEIPVELLMQLCGGLRDLTLLTAAGLSGKGNVKRFSESFAGEYEIVCSLPQEGSYRLPFSIRNRTRPLVDDTASIMSALLFALATVGGAESSCVTVLDELSPSNRIKFSRTLSKFLPGPEERWSVTIESAATPDVGFPSEITFTPELAERARRALEDAPPPPSDVMSVIGELLAVNFERNSLTLRHGQTRRQIECTFRPEVVDQIIQNRGNGVQVTGTFTLDDGGMPVALADVSSVVPVDLSPIAAPQFTVDGRVFRPSTVVPPFFTPSLDEDSGQLFTVRDDSLGIDTFAETRTRLVEELREQLAFMWREYAMADEEMLTESARKVKTALLSSFVEVANA